MDVVEIGGLKVGGLHIEELSVYNMLNLEDTDFKCESLESVRELNLEIVECARSGIEGINCESGDRVVKLAFRAIECGNWHRIE